MTEDTPPTATTEENGNAEGSTTTVEPLLTIPVHSVIDNMHKNHGILQGDHAQYRKYCTRRLSRLRHAKDVKKELGHGTGGRGRHHFVPREYFNSAALITTNGKNKEQTNEEEEKEEGETEETFDKVNHVNYLLVALTDAERAWSHAMEIKVELDRVGDSKKKKNSSSSGAVAMMKEKEKSSAGKIKSHFLRRLRKATHFANLLEEMAKATADEGTVVEAKSYSSWMRGNFALETGNWHGACEEYGSALAICRALGTTSATLELQDYFTARADHLIAPVLQYCQYELQEGGENEAKVLALMQEQQLNAEHEVSAVLKAKLDGIRGEARREQANKSGTKYGSVVYRGSTVPVNSEGLRVALLRIDELLSVIKGGDDNSSDKDQKARKESKDANFVSLLSVYDEAMDIVSSDLQELNSMASGQQVNAEKVTHQSLLGYIQYNKTSCLMERNERMVNELREKEKALYGDEKVKRVEEISHLYDALLQDAREVANLPSPEGLDGIEDEFALVANAHVLRFRALRCYFVSRMYANNGKFKESLALSDHALSLVNQAAEELGACEVPSSLVDSTVQLESEIKSSICRTKASAYLAKAGKAGTSSTSGRSLLHRLDDFDAGEEGERYNLASVPPALQPIPCKPAFFDIALNHVGDIPDLQHHIDAHHQQSKGGFLGWFRRS